MAFKLSKQVIHSLKIEGLCLVIGAVLGVVGTLFVSKYNPPDIDNKENATVVFERIVSQNELVSTSQDYNIIDKARDANTFFNLFEIPLTENSFWYHYTGTIKAGVNLETADIAENGDAITITLDPAYIISNTPNMDESGALEENNNVLNPIHIEDVDAFQRQCVEESEKQAKEGGLLEQAQVEAEDRLSPLFYAALGDEYNVEYVWREAPEE